MPDASPQAVGFGPWAPDLDPAERLARCRALRALAMTILGPTGPQLVAALREAEIDPTALDRAAVLLDQLPAIPMRRLLTTYAALAAPPQRKIVC